MSPASERDVRIEKATREPMMKSERTTVIAKVKAIALTGTSKPGRTLAKNLENGMPPSRAKDLDRVSKEKALIGWNNGAESSYHSCLDAVVTLLIRQQVMSNPTRQAKVIEAAREFVALYITGTQGTPSGVLRTALGSGPIVNMIVYWIELAFESGTERHDEVHTNTKTKPIM